MLAALAAGLLFWGNTGDPASGPSDGTTAGQGLEPFRQAVDDLARAPGLRYRDTPLTGATYHLITVTAGGIRFGTVASGSAGREQGVLRFDDRTFTRRQGELPPGPDAGPGEQAASEWTAAQDEGGGGAAPLGEALSRTPTPKNLADVLSKALDKLDEPDAGADAAAAPQPPRTVRGIPALGLDTSAGRLLVSERRPHRVLRLEPYGQERAPHDGRHPAARPGPGRVTTGPLAAGGSAGMDLTPVAGADADAMYDALAARTRQLGDAVDPNVTLTPVDAPEVSCGDADCTAAQKFTGTVSGPAKDRTTRRDVLAALNATFFVDGRRAGRCTGEPISFPAPQNVVSGTLTCSAPGAGAAYTEAAKGRGTGGTQGKPGTKPGTGDDPRTDDEDDPRADDEDDPRADDDEPQTDDNDARPPARPTYPTHPPLLRADITLDARALTPSEVSRLVARVAKERDRAEKNPGDTTTADPTALSRLTPPSAPR